MFGQSFKSKIIPPVVLVVVALAVILTTYCILTFLSYSDALLHQKVVANTQSLKRFVGNNKKNTQAAAVSMAHNPVVLNTIKARNREKILEIFTSTLDLYQVSFFTIIDENGNVLARTHAPEKFDDSVIKQQSVQNALLGRVYTNFESSIDAKVAVCSCAPVYDLDGTLLGAVLAGICYNTNEEIDLLKERFQAEVAVFLGNRQIASTITDTQGNRATEMHMEPHIVKFVIDSKQEYYGNVNIYGVSYKTFYMPLIDTEGNVLATIFVGTPMSEYKLRIKTLIGNTAIISLIGVVLSIWVLYWAISTISAPLIVLSKEMSKMVEGRLSVVIDTTRYDGELGHANEALKKVAGILHKLIHDIGVTISEHEKGNTDYQLNINDFQGEYRVLADRIAKLSSLGMEDPLTKLPNRRSFDNRLKIEWSRAMREKISLSILMLDLDNFKIYNDTYGHQQGDVALQVVAKVLSSTIKRGFDFAARWGGEEFVVLLPNTNLAGAMQVAVAIRTVVEHSGIHILANKQTAKITVSVGVCALVPSPEDTPDNMIARADKALYQAKETGRNKVCQYLEQNPPVS